MKRIKYYIFFLLGMASLASCSDELKEEVSLNVGVKTEEGVTVQGDVVTVKAGTPVVFNFYGDPDNISFWSGENGSAYANKDRLLLNVDEIESSTLHFKLWAQSGNANTVKNVLHMYVSDNFPGIAGTDFKADSVLVEKFENWTDIEPTFKGEDGNALPLPQKPAGDERGAKVYTADLTNYLGKSLTFAMHYKGLNNSAAQPRYNFTEFYITNKLKNGDVTTVYANSLVFIPVNMMCNHGLTDQKSMTSNREYGTMTTNVSGIWNLSNVSTGSFYIHSSGAKTELKDSWLVSRNMALNTCLPDHGQAVKNMGQNINTYSYTYRTPGEYKATFIATNSNYKHESRVIREMTIKVLPNE